MVLILQLKKQLIVSFDLKIGRVLLRREILHSLRFFFFFFFLKIIFVFFSFCFVFVFCFCFIFFSLFFLFGIFLSLLFTLLIKKVVFGETHVSVLVMNQLQESEVWSWGFSSDCLLGSILILLVDPFLLFVLFKMKEINFQCFLSLSLSLSLLKGFESTKVIKKPHLVSGLVGKWVSKLSIGSHCAAAVTKNGKVIFSFLFFLCVSFSKFFTTFFSFRFIYGEIMLMIV